MTLGGDIAEALLQLRAEAESLMVDTVVVERATSTTEDPDTFEQVPVWEALATLPCRVVRVSTGDSARSEAGQTRDLGGIEFRLPWWVGDLRLNDRLTLQASGDPRLVGVPVHVIDISHATHAVARRVRGVVDEDRRFPVA